MNNPFNDETLRDWFLKNIDVIVDKNFPIEGVVTTGSGPFEENEFDKFLKKIQIQPYKPSENLNTMIVGQDNWDESTIKSMIELRVGLQLKIYSQEMFLCYLFTGKDPFDSNREILMKFAEDHSALEYVENYGFDWPTTYVPPSHYSIDLNRKELLEKGLLSCVGYRVGKNGLPKNERQKILSKVFEINLSGTKELPTQYLKEWGMPKSSARLKKMANCIATFCKNAKKKSTQNMAEAIKDWENDLDWLYNNFYIPYGFSFQWPDTEYNILNIDDIF